MGEPSRPATEQTNASSTNARGHQRMITRAALWFVLALNVLAEDFETTESSAPKVDAPECR